MTYAAILKTCMGSVPEGVHIQLAPMHDSPVSCKFARALSTELQPTRLAIKSG